MGGEEFIEDDGQIDRTRNDFQKNLLELTEQGPRTRAGTMLDASFLKRIDGCLRIGTLFLGVKGRGEEQGGGRIGKWILVFPRSVFP